MTFNGQGLMFFGQEDQNPNKTKRRDNGSELLNIREQNQNWPNLGVYNAF
jgi:hypothetical protein